MNLSNEKLVKSCKNVIVTFEKLNKNEYADIQSKLEWCLGSYEFDNNPNGLIEYGNQSLTLLKSIKAHQPRKVNKKVIDSLEKAIQMV